MTLTRWLGIGLTLVASTVSHAGARTMTEDPDGAARGARLYETKCFACHSLDANRVGPSHRGVFGRRAGSVAGYRYSTAVKQSGIVWNEESLDRWLANPGSLIPGQRMGFRVRSAEQRRDIIAYLRRESKR